MVLLVVQAKKARAMSADDTNDTPEAADHDANKIGGINKVDDSVNEIDNDRHDGAVTGGVNKSPWCRRTSLVAPPARI